MDIDVVEITEEDVQKIFALQESHFVDVKARAIKPAKLSKTISAFANASGGDLYIGIAESEKGGAKIRTWTGFSDVEAANGHLQAFEQLFPLGQSFDYEFLSRKCASSFVLHVAVQKNPQLVAASNGVVYVRRGAQSLPVRDEEKLKRLRLDKGIESFEKQAVDVPVEVVSESGTLAEFLKNVVPSAEPLPWLKKQLLIRNERPVVAGVVVFADEPQAALPKRCGIKVFRYETVEEVGTRETLSFDPKSVEGCLYDQIYAAVKLTSDLVEGIQVLGPKGLEPIAYPSETLHEIITNAALHRDYSIATDIQIRVFDNRIEVESPGKLPAHVTTENILREQYARNPAVVRMVNKFPNPPNKDVGEGLNTAFAAMRKLRLKEPEIRETDSSVVVDIRHERLASPEESVLEFLKTHDEITNRTTRELTGITSENKVKEVFYRLRDRGLLERVPGKKGSASAWQLTETGKLKTRKN